MGPRVPFLNNLNKPFTMFALLHDLPIYPIPNPATVEIPANELYGEAATYVFRDVPRDRHRLRRLVVVRAHRTHHRRDTLGVAGVAVLDSARRGRDWLDRRPRLHVHPVQDLRPVVSALACVQPHRLRAECASAASFLRRYRRRRRHRRPNHRRRRNAVETRR